MTEKLIISVSGMRGIVGESLSPCLVSEYGCAFGTFLRQNRADKKGRFSVCVGRDSRPSGQMLSSAMTAGLCAVGIDVVDLGIVPTPGVGIMLRQLQCDGGVVVTASHNTIEYNGIKLLLGNGIAPSAQEAGQIRSLLSDRDFAFMDSLNCGKVTFDAQADVTHIAKVLQIVDAKAIVTKGFSVVLDSVNGAGGPVTKKLLAELGCRIVPLNDETTGLFAHPPEPAAQNLSTLCETVKAEHADIGFAQDPDADRLAIVDEAGTYIGEEYTLALATKYILGKSAGAVATNLSTSRMIDDIAEEAAAQVIRTAVGEANVAAAMLEHNCIIGGEGNGGVIDLRVGPIRDSLVAIALVLQLMAETGKTVSELVGQIGGYYMVKDKFAADGACAQQILDSACTLFAAARLNTTDGCRFDFDDGWLHLRTSNTEPVMRLIVEAKDRQAAQKYIDAVSNIRKEIPG